MAITIPVTEYAAWRTNELVFTPTHFVLADFIASEDRVFVPNDGWVQLIFKIAQGSKGQAYVTFATHGQVDGLDIDDYEPSPTLRTDSNGVDRDVFYCVGPFDPALFNNADGMLELEYSIYSGSYVQTLNKYYVAAIRS